VEPRTRTLHLWVGTDNVEDGPAIVLDEQKSRFQQFHKCVPKLLVQSFEEVHENKPGRSNDTRYDNQERSHLMIECPWAIAILGKATVSEDNTIYRID
jgi:hypothetical protein